MVFDFVFDFGAAQDLSSVSAMHKIFRIMKSRDRILIEAHIVCWIPIYMKLPMELFASAAAKIGLGRLSGDHGNRWELWL